MNFCSKCGTEDEDFSENCRKHLGILLGCFSHHFLSIPLSRSEYLWSLLDRGYLLQRISEHPAAMTQRIKSILELSFFFFFFWGTSHFSSLFLPTLLTCLWLHNSYNKKVVVVLQWGCLDPSSLGSSWIRNIEGFCSGFAQKLCFVPNVNFTTEQFTDRETGTHRISLRPVIYVIKGAITKISTGPHSRKMTTICLLRLINTGDSTITRSVW